MITSYFNVNPNVVTTFLRVHKKTLTQRQYQRDLNVRRTFRQRLYNVIVLAGIYKCGVLACESDVRNLCVVLSIMLGLYRL